MKKIENYHNDFEELFTVNVDKINRTCETIGYNKNNDYILQIFKEYNIGSVYSEIYEYYLLNKSELYNYNIDILYQAKRISLLCHNSNLVIIKNNNVYNISSHPYEPCLYIKISNEIIITIHNSFSVSEIINMAKENKNLQSISGCDYNIDKICDILICAIDNMILDTDLSYLEKLLNFKNCEEEKKNNNLIELTDDLFYKEYEKYQYCVLDYCIIKNNSTYNSIESHKEAVIFSMKKWKKKFKSDYDYDIFYNTEKMKATKINSKSFFDNSLKNNSYCYLFLQPPHGTNYSINDFNRINKILFPNGFDGLEIYEWSTDWSNYFDDGLEWWGAKCVSIYDSKLNRFVVIGASATD